MKVLVHCPAKLNLFLAVGPKDTSGYHSVRTITQTVALFDELEIDMDVKESRIASNWTDLPRDNTVAKALRLLGEIVDIPPMHIFITKQIPAESGLGGGSSDAAGILRAIKRILPEHIDEHQYQDIAASIGVDVPLFLVGGRVRGEDYGEAVTPLPDLATEWYLIARPGVGCPTAEAYRQLDSKSYPWRDFPVKNELYNDFERVAPSESLELIEKLQVHGAKDAALSGSGSAVFGRFSSEEDAIQAQDALQKGSTANTWACRSLSRSESLRIEVSE